jgi:hypothetical protein
VPNRAVPIGLDRVAITHPAADTTALDIVGGSPGDEAVRTFIFLNDRTR